MNKCTKEQVLLKRIRNAFNTSSLVLSWGKTVFGWEPKENLPGSNTSLLDQIWEPILKSKSSKEIRDHLNTWKSIRGWFMKLLGSDSDSRKALLSCPPKGFQKWCGSLVEEWLSPMSPSKRRAWMTAMFSTRSIVLEGKPDYSAITQDSDMLTPSYREYVKSFWRLLRVNHTKTESRRVRWSDWHLTSKQGPNGHALFTLLRDFSSLDGFIRRSLMVLGGPKFEKAIKVMDRITPWFTGSSIPTEEGKIRKISYFGDAEGKTRVIAVLDYFSQSVLRPLHSWLFRILKRIPQDFTFNQGGFKDHIRDWETFYSCDLSSATDRFPIKVISEVLLGVFPKEYVSAWEDIMVGYPFEIPEDTLEYARGNPMGAYSSWASFTLAHHFVMYVACRRSNRRWQTARYAILGDDVLIGDHILYREYRKILADLDVPVSEAKTHESNILCEFAKRWILLGEEVTPFPIPAMVEAKNYAFLASLLSQEEERGYKADIPSSISLWFEMRDKSRFSKSGVNAFRRRGHYTRLGELGTISYTLIKTFRGNISWEEAFNRIHVAALGRGPEAYMTPEWIASFWGMYLRDLWLSSSDDHMRKQTQYYDGQETDPHLLWQHLMRSHWGEIQSWEEEGLDVRLVPWASIADQLVATADDSYFTVTQLLKGNLSNLEGWEAVRRLVLPSLGVTFRERKYNVIRVLAGKLSSDLIKVLTGTKKITILTSQMGIMILPEEGDPNNPEGRRLVNPLDPVIPSDIIGGEVL